MQTTAIRGIVTEAYLCEEEWAKRLENPLLKNIKMEQYFVETDKKFGTKRLVSGVDIDIFANNIQDESKLDELEHLLYRFRRTKRATEIMDSTNYAVIRAFLKFKQYESLMRILKDRENYGIFPDLFSYNILISTFLKEKLYEEAASTAILMMLQEDFSNKISCVLGVYSCQVFLNNCSMDELSVNAEENLEDDLSEAEKNLGVRRVPFLKNPWFDDHFDITNPKHLIGKTFYLLGRNIDNVVGRSYQIIGLAMYEKWEKAATLLNTLIQSKNATILNASVEKTRELIQEIPEDGEKTKEKLFNQFNDLFDKMKLEAKIEEGDLMAELELHLNAVTANEKEDIEGMKQLFSKWEKERKEALDQQNADIDRDRRLKIIQEKKEQLYWKEKFLFFFENEDKILEELKKPKRT
ncbi:28S ribosomal protein S27, mitochondrial [Caerostris darwini]|uniref:28S ribosomal protein S27, mitochondrial n=1 Tax=Caerostris darwini TaxID=1538125 RepID=A0AAV4VJQ4_9ARAC|nr:28S ribosomal protein S27, mitochondrial [Caerostris darwini]